MDVPHRPQTRTTQLSGPLLEGSWPIRTLPNGKVGVGDQPEAGTMPSIGPEERIGDLWRLGLWRLLRSCRALLSLPVVLSPTLLIRAIWLHESGCSLHNSSVELAGRDTIARRSKWHSSHC